MFQVMYLISGRKAAAGSPTSLSQAMQDVKFYKRRGFTVWVEKDGVFVPVPGATRLPKSLD